MASVKDFPICGIYMIINELTGEQYIGQSRNIRQRWFEHTAPNTKEYNRMHKDIKKQGKSTFDFIILEECSVEELDEKEKYYIAKFHPSYNISTGGRGNYGYKPTEEQKEVSRQAALKQWREMDEETKQRIIKNNLTGHRKGYIMSEDTKMKISQKLKGRKASEEACRHIREAKQRKKENGYKQMNQGHKKPIICTTTSQTFESVKAAGEYFGIDPTSISGVLKGRYKTTHNLNFIYGERKRENG